MAGDRQVHEGATFEHVRVRLRHALQPRGADPRRGREARRHALGRDPLARGGRVGLVRDPAGARPAARGLPRRLRAHVRPARAARRRRSCRASRSRSCRSAARWATARTARARSSRSRPTRAAATSTRGTSRPGTTFHIPVHLPGAHFSIGDPHAAQGDGEVCVAAIECPMRASLRFESAASPLPRPLVHDAARIAHAARGRRRLLRHDGHRRRPHGGRADRRAQHDRAARPSATGSSRATPTCSAAWPATSRSSRSSTPACGTSACCMPRSVFV